MSLPPQRRLRQSFIKFSTSPSIMPSRAAYQKVKWQFQKHMTHPAFVSLRGYDITSDLSIIALQSVPRRAQAPQTDPCVNCKSVLASLKCCSCTSPQLRHWRSSRTQRSQHKCSSSLFYSMHPTLLGSNLPFWHESVLCDTHKAIAKTQPTD